MYKTGGFNIFALYVAALYTFTNKCKSEKKVCSFYEKKYLMPQVEKTPDVSEKKLPLV